MNNLCRHINNPSRQRGALMVATLLILLVISLLGMASVDSTGLEMKMSSNSRVQQQVFEAAEYTLSWVENNMAATGYYKDPLQIGNQAGCGSTCFTSTCTNGYCFAGNSANVSSFASCAIGSFATDPSADSTLWATGSGRYKTLAIPGTNLTTKYIIEYRCFTAKDPAGIASASNYAHMYRITTLATGEDGRSRVMLRSAVRSPN